MNLNEEIFRIHAMMGINESEFPISIKRRLNLSDEKVFNLLKEFIFRITKRLERNKDEAVKLAMKEVAETLFWDSNIGEDVSSSELIEELSEYLLKNYKERLIEFYKHTFEGTNDYNTYCFIKHKQRHIGLGSQGFTECVISWHSFIKQFGYWFPDLDWNEVKEKMRKNQGKPILIKEPLQGHTYEYYFSVLMKYE